MLRNLALRKARSGTGVLPPNPKQWENEHNGLDLRAELAILANDALDHERAFSLLEDVHVMPHSALVLDESVSTWFSGERSGRWSGMCVPCPTGSTLVIYNAHHPLSRIRATLMEEFFHLSLGHAPTRLRVFIDYSATRDFDAAKESEAYGSGAAALLPYKALRELLAAAQSTMRIADHFKVSEQLVLYRANVTKLSGLIKSRKLS